MTASKRTIMIAGALGLLLLVILLLLVASGEPEKKVPVPSTAPSAVPTPSATVSSGPKVYEENIEDVTARHPVLVRLPEDARFWVLEYRGESIKDGKVPLTATVYVAEDQEKDAVISRQRPFIDRFIRKTGQKPGTYTVKYRTKRVDTEGF